MSKQDHDLKHGDQVTGVIEAAQTGGSAMDREQLGQRHAAAIRRHWRTLADNGGRPSAELLGELADIADRHAEAAAPLTRF